MKGTKFIFFNLYYKYIKYIKYTFLFMSYIHCILCSIHLDITSSQSNTIRSGLWRFASGGKITICGRSARFYLPPPPLWGGKVLTFATFIHPYLVLCILFCHLHFFLNQWGQSTNYGNSVMIFNLEKLRAS